ncbi:hypothetical protein D9M73_213170 [compost metagenome]
MQPAGVEQRLGQYLRGLQVDGDHRVPEFLAHVGQGLVAGDAGVVHEDVDAFRQRLHQLLAGIRRTDVQRHATSAQARGEGVEFVLRLRHVEQGDHGAIARQGFRDGRADAAGGAGDHRMPAGQRPAPVGDLRGAGRQPHDLPGDVGALRREEEA